MVRRESDAEAAESAFDGQKAYWAGARYAEDKSPEWRMGWMAAAAEAQRTLTENDPLIKARTDLRAALEEANAAVRMLLPTKATPRQRQVASNATVLIEAVLPKTEYSAAGATPRAAAGKGAARGGSRARR